MNNVKAVQKLNEVELNLGLKTSWHEQYSDSAYVFIGGLDYGLTEGDILAVFSQYGEIVNINLVRDRKTGKSKGFCFLAYENQKSTILAVDNLNGIKLIGRTMRVDHVREYRRPKDADGNEIIEKGCAPKTPTPSPTPSPSPSPEPEPLPMATGKKKKEKKVKKEKRKKKKKKRESSQSPSPKGSKPWRPQDHDKHDERDGSRFKEQRKVHGHRHRSSSSSPSERGQFRERGHQRERRRSSQSPVRDQGRKFDREQHKKYRYSSSPSPTRRRRDRSPQDSRERRYRDERRKRERQHSSSQSRSRSRS